MVHFLDDYYISDDVTIRRAQIMEVVVSHCAQVLWSKKPEKLHMSIVWAKTLKNAIAKRKEATAAAAASTRSSSSNSCVAEQHRTRGSFNSERLVITPLDKKKGANGLSVASADVVLCKEPPRHRSERRQSRAITFEDACAAKDTSERPPSHSPATGLTASFESTGGDTTRDATLGSGSLDDGGAAPHLNGLATSTSSAAAAAEDGQQALTSSPSPPVRGEPLGPNDDDPSDPDAALLLYRDGVAATMPDGDVVFVSSTGSPLKDLGHVLPDVSSVPLHVKRLSGGITNELFHVYDAEDKSASVVVRVFGKETERVISRESELFYQSIFLETYVHGQNFLIYQFLHHFDTLPYTEMAKDAGPISRAIANFQVRATRAARCDRNPPLIMEKSASALPLPSEGSPERRGGTRFERESNYTVHSLTMWVELVSSEEILAKVNPDKRSDFIHVAEQLRAESQVMLAILERQRGNLGESACHNDLLSANIMRHRSTSELKIIDFDYTKRDFFLYDLANHFNEYTGLECDYARFFPSDEHMTNFVATYRQAVREELIALRDGQRAVDGAGHGEEVFPNEWLLFWGDGVSTAAEGVYVTQVHTDREAVVVARWTALVKFLTLCSHLSWSIWSLVQEAVSQLDVDFLEYAKVRLNRYYETKEAYTTGLGFAAAGAA